MNSPYWASGASPGLAALGLQGVNKNIILVFICKDCYSMHYWLRWSLGF